MISVPGSPVSQRPSHPARSNFIMDSCEGNRYLFLLSADEVQSAVARITITLALPIARLGMDQHPLRRERCLSSKASCPSCGTHAFCKPLAHESVALHTNY